MFAVPLSWLDWLLNLYGFFGSAAFCSLCEPVTVSQISFATQIGPTSKYTGP
jgi:hypothetical protein